MQEFVSQLETQRDEMMKVPDNVGGPANIEDWYNNGLVVRAHEYYVGVKHRVSDANHVTAAENFYKCVLRNKEEHELGPSRELLKTIKATIDMGRKTELTLGRITDYLYMTPDGETRVDTTTSLSTEDHTLDQIMLIVLSAIHDLKRDVNQRFVSMERSNNERVDNMERSNNERVDNMERSNNEKFEELSRQFHINNEKLEQLSRQQADMERNNNERFEQLSRRQSNLEIRFEQLLRQQGSSSARFKNQFKGQGGNAGTSSAFNPIANDENQFPSEQGLELLTSVHR